MIELIDYDADAHDGDLRALMAAYQAESAPDLEREFGFVEDPVAFVADTMAHLDRFAPPAGRLLLVAEGEAILGCGALRQIGGGAAEVKRMYLDPSARGRGLGRLLLEALVAAAREEGYRAVYLDTDGLMPAAVALYRRGGFAPCDPYPASDIPPAFHDRWLFLCRDLADDPVA